MKNGSLTLETSEMPRISTNVPFSPVTIDYEIVFFFFNP